MQHVPWPKLKRNLVAILRGISPKEAPTIVAALVEAGFEAVEIPLNSPDPFVSIREMRSAFPSVRLIGAGTVLTVDEVDRLAMAGGNLSVSPNVDPSVIARAAAHGMVTMAGVFTATEALLAAASGASALKFFPANILGPDGIKAIGTILPVEIEIAAVGGVAEQDFPGYAAAGIRTFGLGSSLYRKGDPATLVAARAGVAIAAYDQAFVRHPG